MFNPRMHGFGHGGLEEEHGKVYDHTVVSRMMKYIWPFKFRVAVIVLSMIVYSTCMVVSPLVIKWIIDDHITPAVTTGNVGSLNWAILVFLGVALVQFLANITHLRYLNYVGQEVLFRLRVDLFKKIQSQSMSFFDKNETGKVMSRIQSDVHQLQDVLQIVVHSLADFFSLAGIVVTMFVVDWKLAIATLSVVPPLFVVLIVWQKYARASFLRVRKSVATINSGLQENIAGVRVIQSLNREKVNASKFDQTNAENLKANLQATRMSAILPPSVELMTALGLAIIVVAGGSMVINGRIEVGVVVAFALYVQRFFDPIRGLISQYASLQRAMVSGARIFQLLDHKPDVEDKPDAIELPEVKGNVHFEKVNFHYNPDTPVLKGVNLDVKAGETVALVGPTGAGKTTIVSLLMRMYDVTGGSIAIDGHDIRDVTMESLAKQMSVVPQEPYLFSNSTVAGNIRYNREHVTQEEIERAAKAVGAHDFIMKLEKGYDTELQQRGGNLSVGQRQLISFARALVVNPRILILDEATANIDTETEVQIQKSLAEMLQGRTAFVIAHRLSTVRNADKIVVIDKGGVLEMGTHAQLVAMGGLYARLYSYTLDPSEAARAAAK
ncbi:MAG: ABC transporter ATP-binding protein [SAR202 cluster bacterium]|nr:ABC transporter ATP-binding protein [SAR202 cluster bacterium]